MERDHCVGGEVVELLHSSRRSADPLDRPMWGEPLWWDLTWNSTLQASFSQSDPLQFTVRGDVGLILNPDASFFGYSC